jgi:hypothetical protein
MINMGNTENNVNYQILRFVKEGYTYIEAALKFYDESAEEDDIVKYAKSLDTSIIKEIEREAVEDGKIRDTHSTNIENFFENLFT